MDDEAVIVTISEHFGLGKSQGELDFVNVPIDGDIALFIDPYAISRRPDRWSIECRAILQQFFQELVECIRSNDDARAIRLLQHLREPNETRLGFSRSEPRGAGIGRLQSARLLGALKESSAVRTGFITALEECELMVESISHDKISDITTNVLRGMLSAYTSDQCALLDIPTESVALPPVYNVDTRAWESRFHNLPLIHGKPLLLVPKIAVRYKPTYDHRKYYRGFVLNYLQMEELRAGSGLVYALKNGELRVRKKDVEAKFPCTKEFLFRFSKEHPDVLDGYRDKLADLERSGVTAVISDDDEMTIATIMKSLLSNIPAGNDSAATYHDYMIGIVEFLFFPNLYGPKKEVPINQGRKRIDISMNNGADRGVFHDLHAVRGIPCAYVFFECKNYSSDPKNPELDQLLGRFSLNRGRVGFLCCRNVTDRPALIERCRDYLRDAQVLIVILEDAIIAELLEMVASGRRASISDRLQGLVDEVWLS